MMKGLLKADPQARFRFWGGDKMAAVGGAENLAMHYKKASFMGFVEIAKNLRTILGQIAACKEDVAAYRPDVLILIDYAGFNLRRGRGKSRASKKSGSTSTGCSLSSRSRRPGSAVMGSKRSTKAIR